MAFYKNNKKGMKNPFAANMSLRQQARRAAAESFSADGPKNFADLAPRGPLQVKNQVIGRLVQNGEGGDVYPDQAFRETNFGVIHIDKNHLNGAPFKMTVVCEVLNPDNTNRDFRGKIVEVLGDMGNNDVRMLSVLRQYGLSQTFPDDVIEEVKDLPVNPDPGMVETLIDEGRRDLRDLLTITIDGEDAKDLDDAISIKKLQNGNYKLYVHIADVSNYVREKTALDDEAMLRGTSVYLVDRVIPMLPPKLSNGLCSLNPNVDRLTMTAEMYVDSEGNTYDGDVYESVIRSDRRMSYNEVYRILTEEKDTDEEEYGPIVPMLREMKILADILKRMRDGRGAINFDFPETDVILDEEGNPTDVMPHPITFANGIIEQFMICANEFVAEKFCKMNYPFVYRIHEDPDPIKLARFSRIARSFGATGKLSGDVEPLDIVEFMDTIKDDSAKPMLDQVLLRSMAKACYSERNLGHFGLASKFYCHFTSPIRRYPDLYIHRIIKSYLHNEDKKKHFGGLVANVSDHSSEMERNSVDAERASTNIKVCEYMSKRIGERYEGYITSIIASGVFVMLDSTIEGFVPFRTMADHYIFDERMYRAVGARGGLKLTIGMKVKIVVAAVDTDAAKIDFVFEEGFERSGSRSSGNKNAGDKGPGRRKIKRNRMGRR
ncbi:MAG: ribonuclease R [Clostridiales bacterium]|nr:ribonuclease R [Clostridiales bacterium]